MERGQGHNTNEAEAEASCFEAEAEAKFFGPRGRSLNEDLTFLGDICG